jgi:hypothetical protein
MAEYIERAEALQQCGRFGDYTAWSIWDGIGSIPAADVAPVVHGRWGTGRVNLETGNYEEQCTRCRNFSKEYGKPYCPNCGAKMDGGDGDAAD